jgi:RNA polymerase sigma factor (sigma-70 family)
MPNEIPKGGGSFPETRWSAIVAARSSNPIERQRAFERIAAAYWKPVYKYIRAKWNKSRDDAEDLTQEFFSRVVEKDFLASYDPAKAKLRTFLRTCVDAMVQNEHRAARAQKRGGDTVLLSLEFEMAEGELARTGVPSPERPEDFFEKEWVRSVFTLAVAKLREECQARGKATYFRIFERYDLNEDDAKISYGDMGRELGIAATDVTNYLAWARREFRRITLDLLREMTASEDEFRREARSLLGIEPPE